jgi:hypothetical protein
VALLALSGKNTSFKSTASKIYKRARLESVHKERAKLDVATVNSPGHPDPLGRAVSVDNIFDVENSSGFVSTGKGIMVLDFEESHYTSLRVLWHRSLVQSDDSYLEVAQCQHSCVLSANRDCQTAASAMNPWRLKPRRRMRTGKLFTKTAMSASCG